jgi:hypothetical protein
MDMLHNILSGMGFKRCPVAPCLYYWSSSVSGECMLLDIYVDDGLMFGSHDKLFDDFISELKKHVSNAKMLRPIQKYVGIQMEHNRKDKTISMSQSIYIDGLEVDKPNIESLPMCPSYNLRKELPNENNVSLLPITGKFRFLADRTRLDLLVATGKVSTGGARHPSDKHVTTASKAINYAKSTSNLCLVLCGKGYLDLFAFSDATYNADGDSKSRLGGCCFLGSYSGAFHSFSKNSTLVAQSSMHSEIQALDEVIRAVVYTRDVLEFLESLEDKPTPIFIDNRSAIEMSKTLRSTHKTAAINMRINYLRECINSGKVVLYFVPTAHNIADALTKPLPEKWYHTHMEKVMTGFEGKSVHDYIEQATLVITTLGDEILGEDM